MNNETTAIALEAPAPAALVASLGAKAPWRNWTFWFGPLISIAILVSTLLAVGRFDVEPVMAMLPKAATFWIIFIMAYALTPVSEYVIFRRLWSLPPEGLLALLRKRVSNELLLGYIGEVYFYSWAREHGSVTNTPYGAIKDVAILSALAGNLVTLFLLVPAFPLLAQHSGMIDTQLMGWSISIVGGSSALALLFRKRLFSLPEAERRFVLHIHLARIVGNLVLTALLWHLVLPEVDISWWFLLATLRQLISRLPLLPNKDVVFAGVAVLLIGQNVEIGSLMALMAGLILASHLAVGMLFGGGELFRRVRQL